MTVEAIRKMVEETGIAEGEQTTVGRVNAIREHGKAVFMDIIDGESKIQLHFRYDVVGEESWNFFRNYIERGDFIGVKGTIFRTRRGELSIEVKDYTLLSKALYDPPVEWFGLKDVETRYRQRYLDLLLNGEVREIFRRRTRIIKKVREFLDDRDFLEVDTPVIQEFYGGATARPFTTHVNYLDENRYMQISPELYLKRLVVGGLNRVYTVCKNFRNEEIDVTHNPEFSMMECYQAYADYSDMMDLTEDLFVYVAEDQWGGLKGKWQGEEIDLTPPWRRLSMYDALKEYADLDVESMSDDEIRNTLAGVDRQNFDKMMIRGGYVRGLFIAQLFDHYCQDKLVQPTFITDYPRETVPLCKLHREKPGIIERFELFICGTELGNAYTELNDPILQAELFEEEMKRAAMGADEVHPNDTDFIEAMRNGMPPTGGLGVGIDRMVMLMTDNSSIKEVILFPMMRRL